MSGKCHRWTNKHYLSTKYPLSRRGHIYIYKPFQLNWNLKAEYVYVNANLDASNIHKAYLLNTIME